METVGPAPLRIGVLISGGGSNLQAILDAIDSGELNAKVIVVISNRREAYGLIRAELRDIPALYIGKGNYPHADERENALMSALVQGDLDLVVTAGYLAILPEVVTKVFKNRIINVHPSLIPSFCGHGYYGLKVHEKVLEYGVKLTGATVHYVDEVTDGGPILLQEAVQVLDDDTPEVLQQRVLAIEHKLLPEAIKLIAAGQVDFVDRRCRIQKGV
jgi:phosphoribosylglycinamide formyltransferase-1